MTTKCNHFDVEQRTLFAWTVTAYSAADAQSFVTILGTLRWMIDADVLCYLPISAITLPCIQGIAERILLLVAGRHVGIEADV